MYKRTSPHRGLKARQLGGGPIFTPDPTPPRPALSASDDPNDPPTNTPEPSPPPSPSPPPPPSQTSPSTSAPSTPSSTPTSVPNTSTRQPEPTNTSREPTATATPTSSTTPETSLSSTSSTTSSVEESTSSTQTTPTSTATTIRPPVGQNSLIATSFTTTQPSRSLGPGSTIFASATDTNAPSGALSTGAIVGTVAGGIIAVALIGMIVAFFLRRWRGVKRRRERLEEEEFTTVGVSGTDDTFRPVPPSMAQRQLVTASIVSGPGMAGQGAYGAGMNPTVQERPQYVYGQDYDVYGNDDGREHAAGGPYSSQPQVQTSYNPEAYGSYARQDQQYQAQAYQPQAYQPQQTYQAQAYQPQAYQSQGQDHQASQSQVYGHNGTSANGSRVSQYDEGDAYGGI